MRIVLSHPLENVYLKACLPDRDGHKLISFFPETGTFMLTAQQPLHGCAWRRNPEHLSYGCMNPALICNNTLTSFDRISLHKTGIAHAD
jgi:hypothetical protein